MHKILLSALSAVFFLTSCSQQTEQSDAEALGLVEVKIDDIQQAILSGHVTCQGVVQGYLDRIQAFDKKSGLNAITEISPSAVERARETDAAIARGEPQPDLFCVPVLVKDNFDTYDMPTTGGSIALKGSVPDDDAFMVRRLREAGAIMLAKTNMAEWAFSPRRSKSSSYGITANAYDLTRVPAGSSGGTASGVAANFGVVGLGSDTGNSIRGPSSHLALFGIRSTLGLTSRDGVIPLVFDRDIAGPMTRTVADGARIFNAVAGYDPNDPYTELGKGRRAPDYSVYLKENGLDGARIAVLRALVNTDDADPEITALFDSALQDLVAAGAELVDPFSIQNLELHLEADYFCPRFRYDMAQYLASLGEDAPIKDVKEAFDAGQYSEYVAESLKFLTKQSADIHPADVEPPCPDFVDHPGRQAFLNDVLASMDSVGVDAIVYPSWTNPPAHLADPDAGYKGDNSQLIAPSTGLPAVSVPMGYSYGTLPAGLQILGRPYSEGLLIQYAYAYEQRTQHRKPPEMFPALTE